MRQTRVRFLRMGLSGSSLITKTLLVNAWPASKCLSGDSSDTSTGAHAFLTAQYAGYGVILSTSYTSLNQQQLENSIQPERKLRSRRTFSAYSLVICACISRNMPG